MDPNNPLPQIDSMFCLQDKGKECHAGAYVAITSVISDQRCVDSLERRGSAVISR